MLLSRLSRLRQVALVLGMLLLLSSCEVHFEVLIDVEENGSGVVTARFGMDSLAEERVPNLDDFLEFGDLEATGWTVTPLTPDEDVALKWITATKPFASADQLQIVLDEITGPNQMFKDFSIEREETDTSTSIVVEGLVDFTDGVNLFTDDELLPLLEDPPLGIDLDALTQELGIDDIGEAVEASVVLRLPGDSDDGRNFVIPYGEERLISADVVDENRTSQLLGWVRTAILGLLILSIVIALAGWFLDWRAREEEPEIATPASVRERVPVAVAAAAGGGAAGAAPMAAAGPRSAQVRNRSLQLIVVDAEGVVFAAVNTREKLTAFARERGCVLSDDEIMELHQQGTTGVLTSAEIWDRLGITGNPADLDAAYLSDLKLRRGAKEFLREMRRREMPVAVISNEVAEWSTQLRALRGLTSLRPWITSGELGVQSPDPAAFEAVRRATGVDYSAWLVIGADREMLDIARSLGTNTAWFSNKKQAGDEAEHPVVESFGDFFRRRRSAAPPPARRRR